MNEPYQKDVNIFVFERHGDLTNHCVGLIRTTLTLEKVNQLVQGLVGGQSSCTVQREGSHASIRGLPSGMGEEITRKLKDIL